MQQQALGTNTKEVFPNIQSSNTQSATIPTPFSYILTLLPRHQVFNLSCEFAAAASIIYSYKNDPFFSPQNEALAEKALIAKIPASQNPNIGIRMGASATESADVLYQNLNQKFGGADYYGVHAPPFLDVFPQYGLLARPIQKGNIDGIKRAVFSGHLVMTWIKIGYGQPVDVALVYGKTPVIKGEHAVVIYGYNENGVFIMDPAISANRFVFTQQLLDATSLFPLPFLEVFPSENGFSYTPTQGVDNLTGLDRKAISLIIKNASNQVGAGNTLALILKNFGYRVLTVQKADDVDYAGVEIVVANRVSDYLPLLKRDLNIVGYTVSTVSAEESLENVSDAQITIGN